MKTGEEITVKLYENVIMNNASLGFLGGNNNAAMDQASLGLLGGNTVNEGQRYTQNTQYTQNDQRDQPSVILPNRNTNHEL